MDIFSNPMGFTRSRVTANYALITPDTHVPSPLLGWSGASAIFHITPEMGARFLQYTAILEPGGVSATPGDGISRFVYVLKGAIKTAAGDELKSGDFLFSPPSDDRKFEATDSGATLAIFEKAYVAIRGVAGQDGAARAVTGQASDAPGEAFMGDSDLFLQTLLPTEPAFDMAANVFTYQPGGRLPQVEIHVMEHGLLMLEGEGIYRLGDDWFPVQAGDVIWMASYCPQWFVAMGKQPAKYLYYKDIHRDRLTDRNG